MHPSSILIPVIFISASSVFGADGNIQTDFDPKLPAPMSPMERMTHIAVAPGPFAPDWNSLQAYKIPDWFADAKFGIWAHWGPQSAGEAGDWYGRRIYLDGDGQESHIAKFGHPSEVGYMEVINAFKADQFDPEELMDLYHRAGAQYFMAMGGHHDGVDCWNSQYQPWNTVNIGAKKDLVALWKKAAERRGMRLGVSFHSDFAWWWFQPAFMGSEKSGPFAGKPYDAARLTKADGKGTWWEGLDPIDLYGKALPDEFTKGIWIDPKDKISLKYGNVPNELSDKEYARWYCTKWTRRVQDIIHNYEPDLLYFDGTPYPFSGLRGGRGIATDAMQRITADLYNSNIKKHGGRLEAVLNLKQQDLGNAILLDHESGFPSEVEEKPWQTDNTIGDWFYRPGCFYDTKMVIAELLEVVSRNGNLMLNVMLSPHGTLDPAGRQSLEEMATWMAINKEGIFKTKPWSIWGEGAVVLKSGVLKEANARTPYSQADIRFTQSKDGTSIYTYGMRIPAGDPYLDPTPGRIVIRALADGSPLVTGMPTDVILLGHAEKLAWERTAEGLSITLPATLPCRYALCFKITGFTTVSPVDSTALRTYKDRLRQSPGFAADNRGNFLLPARVANTRGRTLEIEGENNGSCHLTNWTSGCSASWPITVVTPGRYQVLLDQATGKNDGEFLLEIGTARLVGKTQATGAMDTYQEVAVGVVDVTQTGNLLLKISAQSPQTWKPFQLRNVRLVRSAP